MTGAHLKVSFLPSFEKCVAARDWKVPSEYLAPKNCHTANPIPIHLCAAGYRQHTYDNNSAQFSPNDLTGPIDVCLWNGGVDHRQTALQWLG